MRVNGRVPTKRRLRNALDTDAQWAALEGKTPQQIETWLAQNASTVAGLRRVVALLLWAAKARD